MKIDLNNKTKFSGSLKVEVVNPDGSIDKSFPVQPNLILNAGMDRLASSGPHKVGTYGVIGTGTRANKRASGALTITVLDTGAISCSGAFFEAQDVGRILKLATDEEFVIATFVDDQNVTTAAPPLVDLAAAIGSIHYVNETQLETETKRTNSYVSGASYNGTSYAAAALTHKRTFAFSVESGPVTYQEFGVSWGSNPTNLFARALLLSPVSLIAGQQIRVIYELTVAYGPASPVTVIEPITGVAIDGEYGIENISGDSFGSIDASGSPTSFSGAALVADVAPNNRSVNFGSSTSSTALAGPTNSPVSIGGFVASKEATKETYTTGSYARTAFVTFGTSESNNANLRSFYARADGGGTSTNSAFRLLLDSAFEKTNLYTMTIRFRWSWSRTLQN